MGILVIAVVPSVIDITVITPYDSQVILKVYYDVNILPPFRYKYERVFFVRYKNISLSRLKRNRGSNIVFIMKFL